MAPNCTTSGVEGGTSRCACSPPDSPSDKYTSTDSCPRCGSSQGSRLDLAGRYLDDLSASRSSSISSFGGVSSHDVLPLPPDGGWGWVIVLASLVCNAAVDGVCSSFGVLLPHLMDYYGEARAKTAFAGTLMPGICLASGPLASVLINKYGCRPVTIAGSLLTTISLILASQAPSVNYLILFYGVLGGLGMSLIYLPAAVMVGYYFDQKRGLATGLASSGSGLGMLLFAPLTAILNTHYTWQGTLIILSGLVLQCVLMGAMMRPLDISTAQCVDLTDELYQMSNDTEPISVDDMCDDDDLDCYPQVVTSSEAVPARVHIQGAKPKLPVMSGGFMANHLLGSPSNPQTSSCCELYVDKTRDSTIDITQQREPSGEKKSKTSAVSHSCHNLTAKDQGEPIPPRPVLEISRSRHRPRRTHFLSNPLSRKDIFFSGSVNTLKEYRSQCDMNSYVASVTVLPQQEEEEEALNPNLDLEMDDLDVPTRPKSCCPASCSNNSNFSTMMYMLDVSILTNPYFLIISAASVLIQIAFYIPIMFITEYGISMGLDTAQAASLIAVIGSSSMIGRTGAGALASASGVDPLHINNLSLIGAGLTTVIAMLFANSFVTLLIYAIVYGLLIAAFIPLTTVFLVKYVGLDKLTNAFGFLSLVRGVGSMCGAPIGVAIVDATSSYQLAFHFSGALLVASGLVHYLLPVVHHLRKKAEREEDDDECYV